MLVQLHVAIVILQPVYIVPVDRTWAMVSEWTDTLFFFSTSRPISSRDLSRGARFQVRVSL